MPFKFIPPANVQLGRFAAAPGPPGIVPLPPTLTPWPPAGVPTGMFEWRADRNIAYTDVDMTTVAEIGDTVMAIGGGVGSAVFTGGGNTLELVGGRRVIRRLGTGALTIAGVLPNDMRCSLYIVGLVTNSTLGGGLMACHPRAFWRYAVIGGLFGGFWATGDLSESSALDPSMGYALCQQDTQLREIIGLRLSADSARAELNGVVLAGQGGPTPPGVASTDIAVLTDFGAATLGEFEAFYVADAPLTVEQDAVLNTYMVREFRPESAYPPGDDSPLLLVDGDSIDFGGTCTLVANAYPHLCAAALTDPTYLRVRATPGISTITNKTRAAAIIDPLFSPSRALNVLLFSETINSFKQNAAGVDVLGDYKIYGQARYAAGWDKIILSDCMATSGWLSGPQETQRGLFNTAIAADFTTATANPNVKAWSGAGPKYGDWLVKRSTIAGLTLPGSTDAANFTDESGARIHPNNSGHAILAPVYSVALALAGLT